MDEVFRNVDYHIHTHFSDGALSPHDIVDRWERNGYKQIAITDHDGTKGSVIACGYAADRDIDVIPGIEISSRDDEGNTIHILGYGIDFNDHLLNDLIDAMLEWRAVRNDILFDTLVELGYRITMDEILAVDEGRFIGKPTFARVLVDNGYAGSIDEVFEKIYSCEEIKSIKKRSIDPETGIKAIHSAGGVAVFAHPMEVKHRQETAEEFILRLYRVMDKMIGMGIDGVECYHPSAGPEQSEMLREYACNNGLVITIGSDFHSDDNRRHYEG